LSETPRSLLAYVLPPAVPGRGRRSERLAWLWCAGALAVVLATYGDYGVTWDESWHLDYGARVLRWYESWFTDDGALTYRINYYYGGGYDLLGAMFGRLMAPMDPFLAVHLLGGLVGWLGLVGVYRLGRALAGPRAGLLALVMLTLHPVWWGHMFNNPKDSPFAVGYVWSLYFMVEAIAALPRPSRATLVKLAIALGFALSVRMAGLVLVCMFGLVLALFAAHAGWLRRSAQALRAHVGRVAAIGLGVTAGAWAVMLLGWPWAQLSPLRRPLVALGKMSSFDAHQRKMPFAGESLWNYDIGWEYLPHYFAFQTPELVLLLVGVGTIWGVAAIVRRGARPEHVRPALAVLLVGMSIYLPPLYAILKGSPLYDGYRHFLFVVPPMVALAAVTLEAGVAQLRARVGRASAAAWVVTVALLADLAMQTIRLHPQQYVYFNRLVGGVGGAAGRYDTDYYANSYPELLLRLQEHLWRTEPDTYLNTVYYVTGCFSTRNTRRLVPGFYRSFKDRPEPQTLDFHLGYLRDRCDRRFLDAPVVVEVEREGAVLSLARDLRELPTGLRLEQAMHRRLAGANKPRRGSASPRPAADDRGDAK